MIVRRMLAPIAIVVLLVTFAACSDSGNGTLSTAGKGQVQIVMSSTGGSTAAAAARSSPNRKSVTDGASGASVRSMSHDGCDQPDQAFQAANVTFSSIQARTLDGTFTGVTIDLPSAVDMLSLLNGKDATLPIGLLPPGTYDQIVVVMTKVEVTPASGTQTAITPPRHDPQTRIIRVVADA